MARESLGLRIGLSTRLKVGSIGLQAKLLKTGEFSDGKGRHAIIRKNPGGEKNVQVSINDDERGITQNTEVKVLFYDRLVSGLPTYVSARRHNVIQDEDGEYPSSNYYHADAESHRNTLKLVNVMGTLVVAQRLQRHPVRKTDGLSPMEQRRALEEKLDSLNAREREARKYTPNHFFAARAIARCSGLLTENRGMSDREYFGEHAVETPASVVAPVAADEDVETSAENEWWQQPEWGDDELIF
jgi:hypothetical protein